MVKNYSLIFIAFLCFSLSGYGQIFSEDLTSGSIPAGWSQSNVTFSSYARFTSSASVLTSSVFDAGAFTSIEVDFEVAKYGSGTNGPITLEYSIDNGTNWLVASNSTIPTSSTYQSNTISIAASSSSMRIRFTRANSLSEKRLKNIVVTGIGTSSTDTELNFASATYSTNEGGSSINLCVDITNPSATATTANVVLTSSSSPHLSFTTQAISFASGSSVSQCISIPITDNGSCSDSTDYTFEIQSVSGGDSAAIGSTDETVLSVNDDDGTNGVAYIQDFDGGTPTWNYTINDEVNGNFEVMSSLSNITYANISGDFLGINDADDGNNSLEFATVSTAGMTNIVFSFDYDVYQFDSGDDMFYELFYDSVSQGVVKFIDGNSNYSTEGTISISIPDGTNSVAVTLSLYQNGGSDYGAWDNIKLTADQCLTPSPEINLQGNATDIADGNTAISTTDDTDFGDVLVGNSEAHTFTIQNTGTADLDLTTITSSNADFVVSAYTNPTTVTDGASTTFVVTFSPTATGTSTSTITILSNDANEATYNFNVEGNGTAIPYIVLSSTNPAVAASNITDGTDDNVIYAFNLSVLNYEAELTAFNFTTSGSATNADITNFKVWYSTNATFNAGSDTTLQTITTSLGSGSHAVSGISQTIANGSTGYIFMTTDLPCGATDGRTITVNAITTGNLTFTTGNKSGTAYASGTHTITEATPNNVTSLATADCENGGVELSWTAATGCLDNYLIVASTSPLTTSPSGNGSSYTANTTYGSGTAYDSGFVVYKSTGTSTSITALTNGTQYHYTVFTRNGSSWSSGATVNCTPNLAYCDPGSWSTGDSEIEGVVLTGENNAINNITPNTCTNTVQDNTAMSADLFDGDSYILTVEFGECDGGSLYSGAGGVWIDWNNDGDFDDTDELIGTTTLSFSGSNLFENFTINVPSGQTLGNYRMRIIQDEGGSEASIDPCTSPGWGTIADYTIEVIASCTPTHAFTSMLPTSGPEDTEITVTGTGFTASTTASFGAVNATVEFIDATTLIVHVPAGATTDTISLTESGCRVQTGTFTLVSTGGTCIGGNGSFTDIFISEVFDGDFGNTLIVELFNPTNSTISLSGYTIELYSNGSSTSSRTISLTGSIASNSTYLASLGTSSDPCSLSYDYDNGGSGINGDDDLRLYNGTIEIDEWLGQFGGISGYSSIRKSSATAPLTTYNNSDWDLYTTESCSDLGVAPIAVFSNPIVTNITDDSDCEIIDYGVSITEGDSSTLDDITYQWYFNNGVNDVWSPVTSASPAGYTILGEDGDNLLMEGDTNSLNDLANYQFYCEVTEAGSCTNVSNAIKPNYNMVTWNGTWSSTPDIYSTVILDDDYDTSVGGVQTSFSACSLIINNGAQLTIANNTYVKVENDLTVNGEIIVNTDGAFVQVNDYGIVDGAVLTTRNKITVEKQTAHLESAQEYTYWSAPVQGELISDGLAEANSSRIYWYDGKNYLDKTKEANNNNATVIGQDDVDDNADDWQNATGSTVMAPGVGYGATHSSAGFINPAAYTYYFEGPFNNGSFNVPIYRNDSETNDNNWNLIGNPYPSAIDANAFLAANASIGESVAPMTGAIFFWSHATAAAANTNGNENLNYAQSDYAIINGSGQTKGGDQVRPNRFIPSGQAFFIAMDDDASATVVSGAIKTANVVFNNSMRVTGNNDQFFRATTANQSNKLWLNLNTDNGAFNQILIAYVNGATDEDDGMYYDALRNLYPDINAMIYSLLEDDDSKQFAIQGKEPNNLTLEEVITLGLITNISEPTIYTISLDQFEGAFMTENAVYINDKLLNTFHNLKTSDYTFTSETGTINDRFEIVFRPTVLSIDDNVMDSNEVTITELQNGDVQIKVGHTHTIKHVAIIDVTGRIIYSLQGNNTTEVYNLSKLSQAAYIAKITLSNRQVISKKAIKQK
ncbi:choice-of-anchor D domain-containing protein [Winogradskyella helgolandensis]|uniref:choice-of-anchor D domain-containing protein n=1 Tax=Winogradskyella helgolandensis TaxID=2697010 RepID=UPI0015C193F2|nr:choice-of-anchor D domain-containing protein [Winogradskyella helgolandensis]